MTESALMQPTPGTHPALDAPRRSGSRVAVDDFGTGYSSLSYLQRFPIDCSRSTAPSWTGATGDGAVLSRAIVQLGRALDLSVVAEGIERPEQLHALQGFGCKRGQGYLFAPPLPAEDVTRLLVEQPRPWSALYEQADRRAVGSARPAREASAATLLSVS